MSTLTTTVLADGRIEVSGKTFPLREQIKAAAVAAGGKAMWDAERKVWTVPAGTVVPAPPAPAPAPAATAPKKTGPKPRFEWTYDEWQDWIAAYKRRNRGAVERCCSRAKSVGDWYGPRCYSCPRHGETEGSYRGD